MDISIISLFPKEFFSSLSYGIIGRARERGILNLSFIDLRDFGQGKHKKVDDNMYGYGPGMILKAPVVVSAIRKVKKPKSKVVFLSPQGRILEAKKARDLASNSHLVLLCGHYEGVDQRVIDKEIDEEVSIGDYVLTNGALASLVFIDVLTRFLPNAIDNPNAANEDSFEREGLLDYPQYTRPLVFEGVSVPKILVSGNHEEIKKWRLQEQIKKTKEKRCDLYLKYLVGSLENGCKQNNFDSKDYKIDFILEVKNLKKSLSFYKKLFSIEIVEQFTNGVVVKFFKNTTVIFKENGIDRGKTKISLLLKDEKQFSRLIYLWNKLTKKECIQKDSEGFYYASCEDIDENQWILTLQK